MTSRVSIFDSCRSRKNTLTNKNGRQIPFTLSAGLCSNWLRNLIFWRSSNLKYTRKNHQTTPVIKWYLISGWKQKQRYCYLQNYLFFNFLEKILLVLNPAHQFFVSFLWNRTWNQSHHKSSSIIIYLYAKHKFWPLTSLSFRIWN